MLTLVDGAPIEAIRPMGSMWSRAFWIACTSVCQSINLRHTQALMPHAFGFLPSCVVNIAGVCTAPNTSLKSNLFAMMCGAGKKPVQTQKMASHNRNDVKMTQAGNL